MDLKKINIKWVIAVVVILAGAYWAYGYFTGSSASVPEAGVTVTSGDSGTVANASGVDDPFSDLLSGLSNVDLKEMSLLSDPIFKDTMQDFSQPLPTPDVGRPNPFLPVGTNANLITQSANTGTTSIQKTVTASSTTHGTTTNP